MGADGAGTMEAIYYGNCTSWWVASDRKNIPKVPPRLAWHDNMNVVMLTPN